MNTTQHISTSGYVDRYRVEWTDTNGITHYVARPIYSDRPCVELTDGRVTVCTADMQFMGALFTDYKARQVRKLLKLAGMRPVARRVEVLAV